MSLVKDVVQGAVGGLVGTAAMSMVMTPNAAAGRADERPPLRITRHIMPAKVLRRTRGGRPLAIVSHVAYGMGAGALFATLVRRPPPVWTGAVYGLGLWFASYEGWVPAINAMPPAHRDHPERVRRVAAAHVPYGVALAGVLRLLRRR